MEQLYELGSFCERKQLVPCSHAEEKYSLLHELRGSSYDYAQQILE
jgi:hypothetical protein